MKNDALIPFLSSVLLSFFSTHVIAQVAFTEHTIDRNIHGTGGIHATDVDGDSDFDVLAASLEDNEVVYWRNDGNDPIGWAKHVIGSNVYNAHSVYAADFDDNGTTDVMGATYYGSPGIAWWSNDGANPITWTKYTVSSSSANAHEVFAVDLVAVQGSGETPARANLMRRARSDPGNLSGKRLVIWCFAAREFTESSGWQKVPMTGEHESHIMNTLAALCSPS